MVKKNAIIRKLPAVETLGSTTVICSDKTGTLTKNEMTVRKIYVNKRDIKVTGVGFDPKGKFLEDDDLVSLEKDEDLKLLLKIGASCNDASFKFGARAYSIGDPTEIALLVVAAKANIYRGKLERTLPRINEISFSSERKRMSTVHKVGKMKAIHTKGAPEVVLGLCSSILKGGKQVALSKENRLEIIGVNERMAREGLRVLGMAFREVGGSVDTNDLDELEKGLTFVGLQGMMDAPRKEANKAIKVCKEAGIKVIMITGDHKLTAEAVAKELGLSNNEKSLTGPDLEEMTDEELEKIVEKVAVYARTSPEHKMRIVKALKKNGHVVAVTGDGVNDAPALKHSDIGIAMGITGTEVTKEASDMVLADDNFATIVAAVEEGRGIYNNIKKYLAFLLSCNMGEILIMFIAGMMGMPLPLITIHLLWVNLVTDGLPAIALGVDPSEPELMKRPPVDPRESVFTKRVKTFIIGIAIIITVTVLPMFIWNLERESLAHAQSVALTTLVMLEMFNVFNFRSLRQSIFKIGPFSNKWLVIAVASSVLMQLAILYIPGLATVFKTQALATFDWSIILLVSAAPLFLIELAKRLEPKISQKVFANQ